MRTNILEIATELLQRHSVRGFIVPANSGATARDVFQRFGNNDNFQFFAVGNPASSHKQGFVYHSGMSKETKAELEQLSYEVILQEVSAFQPMNSSTVFHQHAKRMHDSYQKAIQDKQVKIEGTTLSWIVERTICSFFDEQVKTCIEIALMAGESSSIDKKGKYISFCTPSRWSDIRDCAVVLTPSTPSEFFQNSPHIYEIAYSNKPKEL
ncbi:MAG: hypothetical protein KAR11_05685 [Phycisphaerae bacterium]|nr:hypothetical protein [Phycisphaerae bacterium]